MNGINKRIKLDIRSFESNIKAYVTFENVTNRNIAIYWVDYNSLLVHYRTLSPSEKMFLTTFKTHPWTFFDADSGERMCVKRTEIYWPTTVGLRINSQLCRPMRTTARIHVPLQSLRNNALWSVSKLISKEGDVEKLEIPESLKLEVLGVYIKIQQHRKNTKREQYLEKENHNN